MILFLLQNSYSATLFHSMSNCPGCTEPKYSRLDLYASFPLPFLTVLWPQENILWRITLQDLRWHFHLWNNRLLNWKDVTWNLCVQEKTASCGLVLKITSHIWRFIHERTIACDEAPNIIANVEQCFLTHLPVKTRRSFPAIPCASTAQCGNFIISLLLKFYVKSKMAYLQTWAP